MFGWKEEGKIIFQLMLKLLSNLLAIHRELEHEHLEHLTRKVLVFLPEQKKNQKAVFDVKI